MAYSLETSSVKTIVPGAEVSGFCDVVARQKINEVSGEVPKLSAGEGIAITNADGKTVITNNISAGENISVVYDMETNTYRIDSTGGATGEYVPLASSVVPYAGEVEKSNYNVSSVNYYTSAHFSNIDTSNQITVTPFALEASGTYSSNGGYSKQHTSVKPRMIYTEQSANDGERFSIGIYHRERMDTDTSAEPYTYFGESYSSGTNYEGLMFDERRVKRTSISNNVTSTNSATWDQILNAATATGGNAFPIVSSDDSTPNYKFIYELDGTASGIEASYTNSGQYTPDWVSSTLVSPTEIKSVISSDGGYTATGFSLTPNGVSASGGWPLPRYKSWTDLTKPTIQWSDASPDVASVYGSGALLNLKRNGLIAVLSNSGLQLGAETGTYDKFSGVYINGKGVSSKNAFGLYTYNQYATWEQILNAATGSQGHTYTGIAPIQVNNTTDEISITGESLSAGPGIDMFSSGGYVVVSSTGKELSAGPGIDLFESGGYFVISGNGGNAFPITGTNGTTGFTANMDCSSMYLSTGAGPAGAIVHFDTKGVHFEAYPSTDVSASWFNLITQYNNATCSAVKLTTAASETRFVTSALPNLNEITFIAPSYGPYETYSALIDDGETTFVAEVDSGCCVKVVRNWNDDRGKNCWCGLNQETYFYIG